MDEIIIGIKANLRLNFRGGRINCEPILIGFIVESEFYSFPGETKGRHSIHSVGSRLPPVHLF